MQGGMPFCAYPGGVGIPALIALAVGYFVCVLAGKEKGKMKKTGYVIGIAIIAFTSIIILSKVAWMGKKYLKTCPIKGQAMPTHPGPMSPRK